MVALFAALLIIGWGGAILQGMDVVAAPENLRWPMLIVMGTLTVGLAFAAIPVMVMLVLGFQKQIGNKKVPAVAAAIKRQNFIIYALWGLMALGTVVALPGAYFLGAFNNEAKPYLPIIEQDTNIGPSQGMLVARPGMTLDEMKKASSLAIDTVGQRTPTGAVASGIVFDFTIAGTHLVFPRCRYYFASTYANDKQHIESLSIGTSTFKMDRPTLNTLNAGLRTKLAADDWLPGHAHGGAIGGPEDDTWAKNGMILHIQITRMDDPKAGEDAAIAGEWIQTISLWVQKDYPYLDRYTFAKASQ
ncbi:MAG TPA: hypothetical protein VH000_09490 [Rhizomicrobium sp.]|nr:hypothetical protein [Rhizomicrobium sp.]